MMTFANELQRLTLSSNRVGESMGSKIEEKWIKHYSSRHKILLVGEGDFSFALSLANAFGSASNMVATSRDSKGSLVMKYSRASAILEELESLGCTILLEVDAHTTHKHSVLQHKLFDRIVYNFPHAGFGLSENNPYQIWLHQEVVLGFLKSARKMLTRDGEVHVTHKNHYPYCNWEIVKLAEKAGLVLVEKVSFEISEYPGYVNKRGSGNNCDGSFSVGDSSTFKFSKPKDVESFVLGLSVLLLDPDPLELINYVSKTKNLMGCGMDSKMEEEWINVTVQEESPDEDKQEEEPIPHIRPKRNKVRPKYLKDFVIPPKFSKA